MLGKAEFDEEGTEHSDTDAKGNDEPEIDAACTDACKPVDEGA